MEGNLSPHGLERKLILYKANVKNDYGIRYAAGDYCLSEDKPCIKDAKIRIKQDILLLGCMCVIFFMIVYVIVNITCKTNKNDSKNSTEEIKDNRQISEQL